MRSCLLLLACCAASCLAAQTVHQVTEVPQPTGSYIAFKFDWDQGRPWLKYTITVDDAGSTSFKGVANPIDNGDGDDYLLDFTMSGANRDKIFELAKQADYFQGTLESKAKNIAKTGQKTLEYHGRSGGGVSNTSATYNYSSNKDVQQLTQIFQSVATTIDMGRRLAFDYRFDKLGLDARLRSLQELQASHFVNELQAIEPILKKIAADPNVMHVSRVAAKQLISSISTTAPPAPTATQP